jgi:hypothetical protein
LGITSIILTTGFPQSQALYTGSEDSVLSGWSIPSSADGEGTFLRTGDPTVDDDGGDGRGEDDEDDEMDSEESEEEMSVGSEDEDEVERDERGKRVASEVWGDGGAKKRR